MPDENCSYICGNVVVGTRKPHSIEKLLNDHGLSAISNEYCVRINKYDHFKIEFDKELSQIDADSDSIEEMLEAAIAVSNVFTESSIKHRFEVYNEKDELVKYLHYNWPQ